MSDGTITTANPTSDDRAPGGGRSIGIAILQLVLMVVLAVVGFGSCSSALA